MDDDSGKKMFLTLTRLCDDLAWDRLANEEELYTLTRENAGPKDLVKLAEAFGLMLVKLEARKIDRENLIRDLKNRAQELEKARLILSERNSVLNQAIAETYNPRQLIGQCEAIRKVAALALSIARRPINTMILGPTGSGKEVVAKMIHFNSPRREKNFIAVNCTAIADTLFESEMFGIEKGVATGVERRRGLIEEASGGTLFLDEVADMNLANQAKLLRALEEREVMRVGSSRTIAVDLRVISATNVDLARAVKEKKFREDLYYRLNVAEIRLPSLAERGDDVIILAKEFLARHSFRLERGDLSLSKEAIRAVQNYHWPGNVRELNNEMERAAALTAWPVIGLEDLSEKLRSAGSVLKERDVVAGGLKEPNIERVGPSSDESLSLMDLSLLDIERKAVEAALTRHNGNRTRAAHDLGLSREGLRKKIKRLWPDQSTTH
jgi:transcriptional regulator with PAS, ATPase and Fis domain